MANTILLGNGETLKVNGKEVFEEVLLGSVKQVDVEKRKMTMIGTNETVDRDGDIVLTNGGKLDNYRKNPVYLWAHDYHSVPLARAEKIIKRRDPIRMEFHLIYPSKGLHPFADMILDLYGENMINASSIGFIPNQWEPIEQEGERKPNARNFWNPRKYTDWELLELSGCAVPANPDALQNALKAKAFMGMPIAEVQKLLQGKVGLPMPPKVDDIMGELQLKMADFIDETKPVMIQVPKEFCTVEEEEEKKEDSCDQWDGKVEELEVPPFEKDLEILSEDVLKPFPSEHSCRLEEPGQFERFARKNCYKKHAGKCIDFIFGYPKDGGGKLQAMRYPKDIWTAGAAKSHCASHKGSFEAAKDAEPEGEKTVYVIKAIDVEDFVKFISDKIDLLREEIKTQKPTGTDLAVEPMDQGSKGGKQGLSASEAILGEAFTQGKVRTEPTPTPSQPQYDYRGVMSALKDLKDALKLKGD